MKKFLIFDLDGTLFDSVHTFHKVINILFTSKGYEPVALDFVKSLISEGLSHFRDDLDKPELTTLKRIYQHEEELNSLYMENCLDSPLFEGVLPFLRQCQKQLCIVSNKKEVFVKKMIAESPLKQFQWLSVNGGDTFSKKKPDPMPLIEVMKQHGFSPEESLLVGDGVPDAMSAKAAKVDFFGVEYGYAPSQKLVELGAVTIIEDFSQLNEYI